MRGKDDGSISWDLCCIRSVIYTWVSDAATDVEQHTQSNINNFSVTILPSGGEEFEVTN